jgi:hypothetical protein
MREGNGEGLRKHPAETGNKSACGVWVLERNPWPIGLHGALLPLIMAPLGVIAATCGGLLTLGAHGAIWFHSVSVSYSLIAPLFFAGVVAYYLVWKYVVGFLNQVLGIA